MSPLIFLMKSTLKNLVKGAFKKPIVLIGYILIVLFFGAMVAAAFFMPSGLVRKGSPELFKGIMLLVFTLLYYTTLKLGVDKGSTYFRMADVNLVFTAPIRANQVLLYAFIKQIGGTFLLLFIATFQIPNLRNNFEMVPYGVPLLMLAVVMYALSYPLVSMVIYSWASKAKARRKMVKRIMDLGALAVGVLFLINLSQTRNIGTTIDAVFTHPVARYFPIVGWTGSIGAAAASGITTEFWVGLTGMVVLIIGASVALYRMNLDYYEDVLEGTEYVEAALKAKREGNNLSFNLKVKSKVSAKLSGTGASTLFFKQLLEIRKTAYLLFFDRISVIVIIAAIAFKFMMPEEMGKFSMFLVLGFSVYMLLLFQIQGRLGNELDKHFVYLIPASPQLKLFYTTLSQHVKNLFDGAVLFVLAGVLFKSELTVILACILTYTAFGAVFVYTDVLSRRLFGWVHSKGLLLFLKIMVSILIFIPGIVAAVIAGVTTRSELLMICALGGWSFILAVTLFIFSSGIINNLEAAG